MKRCPDTGSKLQVVGSGKTIPQIGPPASTKAESSFPTHPDQIRVKDNHPHLLPTSNSYTNPSLQTNKETKGQAQPIEIFSWTGTQQQRGRQHPAGRENPLPFVVIFLLRVRRFQERREVSVKAGRSLYKP